MSKRYLLRIEKPAVKVLDTLPHQVFKQIILKLFALQADPKPQNFKKPKGYPNGRQVDQGVYRILSTLEGRETRVLRVGKRDDDQVYRNP